MPSLQAIISDLLITGSSQDKMVILMMMMMMMTFHNFAGYEFVFAFKQPDVTYVTSVYFRGAVKDKVTVKVTDVSRYFSEHRL